jgi:hypothetical protein
MLRDPIVRNVMRTGGIRCGGIKMEWQELPDGRARCVCRIGLLECHAWIGKSTDAAVSSEIMIEGAVFLNEDYDVFDVR